jgi:hypothetical protein
MCKGLTYVCPGRFTCVQACETRVKGGRGGGKRQTNTQAIPMPRPPNRQYVRWVCGKGTVSICKACTALFTFASVKSRGLREARRFSTSHKCQGAAPLYTCLKNVANVKNAACTTQVGGLYTYRSVRRESTLDICDTEPECLYVVGLGGPGFQLFRRRGRARRAVACAEPRQPATTAESRRRRSPRRDKHMGSVSHMSSVLSRRTER